MKTGGGVYNAITAAVMFLILFGVIIGIIYLIVLFIGLFYEDAYKVKPYLGYIWVSFIGLGFLMGSIIPDTQVII
jgi:lipopolysaccharide export LptBFGC system permease protein LptF